MFGFRTIKKVTDYGQDFVAMQLAARAAVARLSGEEEPVPLVVFDPTVFTQNTLQHYSYGSYSYSNSQWAARTVNGWWVNDGPRVFAVGEDATVYRLSALSTLALYQVYRTTPGFRYRVDEGNDFVFCREQLERRNPGRRLRIPA